MISFNKRSIIGIFDNVAESFVSGILISGAIQSPRLYAAMKAPFQSQSTTDAISKKGR